MKVVIIGGGIAGLTLAALLNEKNIDFVVSEKSTGSSLHGHAFLMHTDSLNILNELSNHYGITLPGNPIHTISLHHSTGQETERASLYSWKCMKRSDVICFLTSLIPQHKIKSGRQFSHFLYEADKAVAAVFMNGDVEYGSLFIGADGSRSKIRQLLFGKTQYTPTQVKEIVGIAPLTSYFKERQGLFTKYQHSGKGLSFGAIPVSADQLVWFMQYDCTEYDIAEVCPENIASFCRENLSGFPDCVKEIIEVNDFTISHIWNTTDFDLLPAFHHQNVALIGDAAHLALPFTSAGTTNAIIDAKVLTECLQYIASPETALQKFYTLRSEEVAKHTILGRQLKELFLSPQLKLNNSQALPLISRKQETVPNKTNNNPIQILYFTDPICSTCWIIQPQLRKLKLEYGNYINIKYCMGGLLSCWEDGNTGSIKSPNDAATHWEEACRIHDMPMDGDVWIEDPLNSSYPPSIAFKAAQLQDENKAVLFLRRIQEMVFLEKKNIIKWNHIENAAFDVGLDIVKLLSDFKHRALNAFKADLELAKQHKVTSFPTLFFSDSTGKQHMLKGNQHYDEFENIIVNFIPTVKKQQAELSPKELFTHFPTLTDKEFAMLSNSPKEHAATTLTTLLENGHIEMQASKNGTIWKAKPQNI